MSNRAPYSQSKNWLRGIFLWACFVLISVPMFVHLLRLETPKTDLENRSLAEYPGKPKTPEDWFQFTARFDRYLDDHFGLRQTLVQWNQAWRYQFLHDAVSPQITLGSEDYLFFNAHEAKHPMRMLSFICGRSINDTQVDELAQQVTDFARFAKASNANTTIAFVPSKPAVYSEYLPSWWQQECAQFQPTLSRMMTKLEQGATQVPVLYPLAQMMEFKRRDQLYPHYDFHWQGKGAQAYAQILAEQIWGQKPSATLVFRNELSESDMQRFMPGVDLRQNLQKPDWQKNAWSYCEGAACFPEMSSAAILGDVTRFKVKAEPQQNTQTKKRLLLITDSFGHGVAPYFAPYFDEVWHVSSNNMGALNPQQLDQLKQDFERYAPTRTLYLFHDFALSCFSQTMKYCPLELPPVLREIHPSVNVPQR